MQFSSIARAALRQRCPPGRGIPASPASAAVSSGIGWYSRGRAIAANTVRAPVVCSSRRGHTVPRQCMLPARCRCCLLLPGEGCMPERTAVPVPTQCMRVGCASLCELHLCQVVQNRGHEGRRGDAAVRPTHACCTAARQSLRSASGRIEVAQPAKVSRCRGFLWRGRSRLHLQRHESVILVWSSCGLGWQLPWCRFNTGWRCS